MTLAITTKPGKKYASIKNPRVYEALRRQGMSKTRAARISNAQAHKDAGTVPGAMLSGPGGLLATPGMGGGRKWGNRRKDADCTCGIVTKGEQLAPGITRIRGNLCNVHGRYGLCPGASKQPKAPKGRKPRTGARPAVNPTQRAQERHQQKIDQRNQVLHDLGIDPGASEALAMLRNGEQPEPSAIERMGAIKAGLVEQAADGSYRMTPSGRALLSAAESGDVGRAGDIISGARDRTSARTTRQEAAAQKKRDAEAKRAKKAKKGGGGKGGGGKGGGGGSKQGTDRETERQADRARRQAEHEADRKQRQTEHEQDRARQLREHDEDRAARLEERRQRLAERRQPSARPAPRSSGAPIVAPLAPHGHRQRTKAETYGGVTRSKLDDDVFAGPDRSFPIKTAQDVRDAVRSLGRTKHDKVAVKRGIIRRAKAIGAMDALPDSWREQATTKALRIVPTGGDTIQGNATVPEAYLHARTYGEISQSWLDQLLQQGYAYQVSGNGYALYEPGELVAKHPSLQAKFDHIRESNRPDLKSLTVFKDASGAYRWLARSTTAYRDRDREILPIATLDTDSQRMTSAQQFGPLRWWHVGKPDPFDAAAPWGVGLDIGDCDYSAQIGTTRVESGTFRDPALAARIAVSADEYELSPGFFHPYGPNGPPNGVYQQIRTFERSLVPTRYGRASNLFTGLTVKEFSMDPNEMERRFKAAIEQLRLSPEQAETLAAGLVAADKSATAQGIAFKSDDAPAVYTAPDGTQGLIVDGRFVALKAAGAMDAEDDPALGGDMGSDEAAEGEPPLDAAPEGDGGEYIGDMTPAEFWDQLKTYLTEMLAPQSKMEEMAKAFASGLGEMKALYATKDAGAAQRLAAIEATLAQLVGDQPAITQPADVEAAVKSAGPQAPPDPAAPQIPDDPDRPFAPLVAHLLPQLYGGKGPLQGYGPNGWTYEAPQPNTGGN